jgi:hypothetical protein
LVDINITPGTYGYLVNPFNDYIAGGNLYPPGTSNDRPDCFCIKDNVKYLYPCAEYRLNFSVCCAQKPENTFLDLREALLYLRTRMKTSDKTMLKLCFENFKYTKYDY